MEVADLSVKFNFSLMMLSSRKLTHRDQFLLQHCLKSLKTLTWRGSVRPTPPACRSPQLPGDQKTHASRKAAGGLGTGRRGRDGGRRLAPLRRRRPHPGLPLADPPPRHPRTALPSPFPPTRAPPPLLPLRIHRRDAVSPSRAQVSILALGAAAVFFEHIRKIGCMHS